MLSVFFDLHILVISFVSFGHCVVCLLRFTYAGYLFGICWPLCCLSSSIYICWLSLWYLLAIVLSVFFVLRIMVISLVSVGHCVVCLLRFTYAGYLFGICWPLCCLSSSIYIFWLSLWYLLAIGLFVFFDLRILAISFVSFCHCVVCLLRFTDSCYLFCIFWPLVCLCSSIYGFWLSLSNLLAIVLSFFFDLHILVFSLVSFGHCVFCLLRFKVSWYIFGICCPLCCLSSSIYGFWLTLWYMLAIVVSVFFDLQILVISLISVGHCVVCLL